MRSELAKHENFLKNHNFKDLSRTLNRVSLPDMFGVLNKEWLAKLALLRDVEEKIKADFRMQQLFGEHRQILKAIKRYYIVNFSFLWTNLGFCSKFSSFD